MSFTDRFIKVPIKIADRETAEFIKDEDWEDSYEMINPLEISSFRPATDYGAKSTAILFKNGADILVCLPIDEFKSLLNIHFKKSDAI